MGQAPLFTKIVEAKNFSSPEINCFHVETKCFSSLIKAQIPQFGRDDGGFNGFGSGHDLPLRNEKLLC